MATYDIGDRSLIFKRISMYLQETYMSTLEVSDEYTLDLAKCVYEYLRDFYPNTHRYWFSVMSIPSDFLSTLSNKNQNKYYKRKLDANDSWTGEYELAQEGDTWSDNAYFIKGPEYSISDIYAIGLQIGILGDGTPAYNENFPGIYTYTFLGATKDLTNPADILKLSAEEKIYTLSDTTTFLQILENPQLSKLYAKYQTETENRESGKQALSDREYNLILDQINNIQEQRSYFANVPNGDSSASDVLRFVTDGLNQVNKYNIKSWPINETILQYVCPETVITESSNMDDIAQMQLLAEAVNYVPGDNIGLFDSEFETLCRTIQSDLQTVDSRVIVTGYCDIFVERYLRSRNNVRAEVY